MFKIFREPELCELFSNFLTVNQHFLVHENWYKNLKLSLKNGREPELCEPELCEPLLWNYVNHGSHFPLVNTFPWFTLFHGSHNGQAPQNHQKTSLSSKNIYFRHFWQKI